MVGQRLYINEQDHGFIFNEEDWGYGDGCTNEELRDSPVGVWD